MAGKPQQAQEFDLSPDPRILPMLGEINLLQWRCIAELVDNSVDGFLYAVRSGSPIQSPEVAVALPLSDAPNSKITVRDNGPGMDLPTLEKAVRAGWSGQDSINSLGMFGMGFNIATARLGTVTQVWTTRAGDAVWHGLEIDFEKLLKQRHFKTPHLTRPKADPHEHGTEISIERLKPEQRAWFASNANRSKVMKELGKSYSSMLKANGKPLSFKLTVGAKAIQGKEHCVWGGPGSPQRAVSTAKHGVVDAYQAIDVNLPDRPFCLIHSLWLPADSNQCIACEESGQGSKNVIARHRRIYGWLGIQRYLSAEDYGIDFLRNGRKLEIGNRDLFAWNNGESDELEYPIDDPRHRGRIVGEIHIDHCRVNYTKDRFDRTDPAWDDMVKLVRGHGPLRPDKAAQLGYGQNSSPLFMLFQAFRRSSPKPKVAGCYAKLLIVPDNDLAEQMANRFYSREQEFLSDLKWFDLVEEADRNLLVTPPAGPAPTPNPGIPTIEGFGGAAEPEPAQPGPSLGSPTPPRASRTQRSPIASLTREYREDSTEIRFNVKAFKVEATDPDLAGAPWAIKRTPSSDWEFLVSTSHEVFNSATLTPLDALLAQLAERAVDFMRGNTVPANFATALSNLRSRYALTAKLDPVTLSAEAIDSLHSIAESLTSNLKSGEGRTLFNEFSPGERDAITHSMAARATPNPQQAIDDGRFLSYAPKRALVKFIQNHPELFFDGKYWSNQYSGLDYGSVSATGEARRRLVQHFVGLLDDVVWLSEQSSSELANVSRARLLRAALATELLNTENEPGDAS